MELIDFAKTERQKQVVKLRETMTLRQIAKEIGVSSTGTVAKHYETVLRNAARQGFSPDHDMTHPTPETHYVKGTSTLYGEDGKPKLQWVKTNADQDRMKMFAEELATSICETITPTKRRVKAPVKVDTDRLTVYPVGDAHIGLYCWNEDAEEDWKCETAERVMAVGFDTVMSKTFQTEQAVIANVGDWYHADSQANATPQSGHRLDVDTRWPRVAGVGVRIMKYAIDTALRKHKIVHVINEVGNHDPHMSIMLSMVLDAFYSNNDRVRIDTSPDVFHWFEFHNNFIGVHHGDRCKPQKLYEVMTEEMFKRENSAKFRYWYTGHFHTLKKQEIGGTVMEGFRTLTARDTYAHSNGYRSGRDICGITLDREYGECDRATVNVEACRGAV